MESSKQTIKIDTAPGTFITHNSAWPLSDITGVQL